MRAAGFILTLIISVIAGTGVLPAEDYKLPFWNGIPKS
jgi:hypothetical protein